MVGGTVESGVSHHVLRVLILEALVFWSLWRIAPVSDRARTILDELREDVAEAAARALTRLRALPASERPAEHLLPALLGLSEPRGTRPPD